MKRVEKDFGRLDATTQLLFEPVELLERLAALTPRSRINLLP